MIHRIVFIGLLLFIVAFSPATIKEIIVQEEIKEVTTGTKKFAEGSVEIHQFIYQRLNGNQKITCAFPVILMSEQNVIINRQNKFARLTADSTIRSEQSELIEMINESNACKTSEYNYHISYTPTFLDSTLISGYYKHDFAPSCEGIGDNWILTETVSLVNGKQIKWEQLFVSADSVKWAKIISDYVKDNFPYDTDNNERSENDAAFQPETYFHYTNFVINENSLDLYIKPLDVRRGEDIWISIPSGILKQHIAQKGPLSE